MGSFVKKLKSISLAELIFWKMMIIFAFLVIYFALPMDISVRRSLFPLMALLAFSLFLLGLALIFLTLRRKLERNIKKFLLLTGISSTVFFTSMILHNVVYGLFIHLFGSDFWTRVGLEDEPFFFIIAVFVCPVGFLAGAAGSIVLLVKKRKNSRKSD